MQNGQPTIPYTHSLNKATSAMRVDHSWAQPPHFKALVDYRIIPDSDTQNEQVSAFINQRALRHPGAVSVPFPNLKQAKCCVIFNESTGQDFYYQRYISEIEEKLDTFTSTADLENALEKIKNNRV